MVQDQSNNLGSVPLHSAEFGTGQNGPERFRTIPKASEPFGKIRSDSAQFGNIPKDSEEPKGGSEPDDGRFKELERENLDLKIANRGKDYPIEQIKNAFSINC